MIGKDKQNLQLRFDLNDPTVKKVLPVLDLLSRKKNYVVVIALNEFFEKYGLYDLDAQTVRESIKRYGFMRHIHSHMQYMPDLPTVFATDPDPKEPNETSGGRDIDAQEIPIPASPPSGLSSFVKPNPDTVTEEETSFDGDPQVEEKEKEKMINLLNMFNV